MQQPAVPLPLEAPGGGMNAYKALWPLPRQGQQNGGKGERNMIGRATHKIAKTFGFSGSGGKAGGPAKKEAQALEAAAAVLSAADAFYEETGAFSREVRGSLHFTENTAGSGGLGATGGRVPRAAALTM
jgi:hypothetical protein